MARISPLGRDDYRHFTPIQTRWFDNDAYGHLNNTVHYTLFDTAANKWLIDNGFLDIHAGRIIGLMVESGCRYHGEIVYPEPIEVGLRVGHIGGSSVRYEMGIFAGERPISKADGFIVHVYVDRETRRPTPIGEAMREGLGALV